MTLATPRASGRRRTGAARYRLSGAGAFEAVFKSGARRDGLHLQLVFAPAAADPGRVGYVIGKKMIPRAVDRNRLRRMLRPVVAGARSRIERYDLIVRLRRPCERSAFPEVVGEAARLIDSLPGTGPSA